MFLLVCFCVFDGHGWFRADRNGGYGVPRSSNLLIKLFSVLKFHQSNSQDYAGSYKDDQDETIEKAKYLTSVHAVLP